VPYHAPPDVEYVVYRIDGSSRPVQAGVTHFADASHVAAAHGGGASPAWYVVARSAGGAMSSPSPTAALP
jgi:hypothetical protein